MANPHTPDSAILSLLTGVGNALDLLRARRPLVHCITNSVTVNDVANSLLALGARPVMATLQDEVPAITRQAQALYVNLGTPDQERADVVRLAATVAHDHSIPLVLDPVGVGSSPMRLALAHELIEGFAPTVVRGNQAEVQALAGKQWTMDDGRWAEDGGWKRQGEGGTQSGVDALSEKGSGREWAETLASRTQIGAVAVSGKRDWISILDPRSSILETYAVDNGHPWLQRMSGAGCVVTALIAAFAVTGCSSLVAALGGLLTYEIAAERAATIATGPGTLRPLLLDALYHLQANDLITAAQVSRIPSALQQSDAA